MEAMKGLFLCVKRGLFMMSSGPPRAWNLLSYMDSCLPKQQCLTRNAIHFLSSVQVLTIRSDGTQKENAFWDYSEKKLLGATKAECSVTSEWSPDGRYFMTATTAPRLQIDNGIKIFHYNGALYFKKMFDKLYQADWKPEAPERFADITDLVKSIDTLKINDIKKQDVAAQDTKSSQPSSKISANTIQKPAAYRPPHAKTAAAVQAELFGESASSEGLSKNAMRNKKRREKQKEKKAGEASAPDNGS